jgi:hypothetical protein
MTAKTYPRVALSARSRASRALLWCQIPAKPSAAAKYEYRLRRLKMSYRCGASGLIV